MLFIPFRVLTSHSEIYPFCVVVAIVNKNSLKKSAIFLLIIIILLESFAHKQLSYTFLFRQFPFKHNEEYRIDIPTYKTLSLHLTLKQKKKQQCNFD